MDLEIRISETSGFVCWSVVRPNIRFEDRIEAGSAPTWREAFEQAEEARQRILAAL